MKTLLPLLIFFLFFSTVSASDDISKAKKILGFENESYDAIGLKELFDRVQHAPLDGLIFAVQTPDSEGKSVSTLEITDPRPWNATCFDSVVAELKDCRRNRFTDNFLRLAFESSSSKAMIAWTDDEAWNGFCAKNALCAEVAKKLGCKGLAVDFETKNGKTFQYSSKSGLSFAETREIVRKRGRQWMTAVSEVFPDMVLLNLFLSETNLAAGLDEDFQQTLSFAPYGLFVAFFNGMLDVLPAEAQIVDGGRFESLTADAEEFHRRTSVLRSVGGPALRLIAPENRQKYLDQVRVGFGIGLDPYVKKTTPLNASAKKTKPIRPERPIIERFDEAVNAALDFGNDYVYLYGDKANWRNFQSEQKPGQKNERKIEGSDSAWKTWDEAIPGCDDILKMAAEPVAMGIEKLKQMIAEDRWTNFILNSDFHLNRKKLRYRQPTIHELLLNTPLRWWMWQASHSTGIFSWDDQFNNGAAKAENIRWGCFFQPHSVRSGERYYVSLDALSRGKGQISLSIRWQDDFQRWIHGSEDYVFFFKAEPVFSGLQPLEEDWFRADGFLRVPEGASRMLFLAAVKEQASEEDEVWFDNAFLIRLEGGIQTGNETYYPHFKNTKPNNASF